MVRKRLWHTPGTRLSQPSPPLKQKQKKTQCNNNTSNTERERERERNLRGLVCFPQKPGRLSYHTRRKRRVWVEIERERSICCCWANFPIKLRVFSFFLCVSCVVIGVAPMTATPQLLLSWDKIEAIKRIVNGVLTPLTNDATRNLAVVKISKTKMKRKWRKKKEKKKEN